MYTLTHLHTLTAKGWATTPKSQLPRQNPSLKQNNKQLTHTLLATLTVGLQLLQPASLNCGPWSIPSESQK